jgi:hypothetical protein
MSDLKFNLLAFIGSTTAAIGALLVVGLISIIFYMIIDWDWKWDALDVWQFIIAFVLFCTGIVLLVIGVKIQEKLTSNSGKHQ